MSNVNSFLKYVGQKVLVDEISRSTTVGGEKYNYTEYKINKNDTIIDKMETEVTAAKLILRLFLPDTMGTMDYNTGRLNVHVKKQADGLFEIERISIG